MGSMFKKPKAPPLEKPTPLPDPMALQAAARRRGARRAQQPGAQTILTTLGGG